MHSHKVCLTVLVVYSAILGVVHGRYLPTRSYNDNLEKLRELMYQILESSNENQPEIRPDTGSYQNWNLLNNRNYADVQQALKPFRGASNNYKTDYLKLLRKYPNIDNNLDDLIQKLY